MNNDYTNANEILNKQIKYRSQLDQDFHYWIPKGKNKQAECYFNGDLTGRVIACPLNTYLINPY